MAMTREQFKKQLVYEEKMTQIAINTEKLEQGRFVNMVTKNLMIIVHTRKKYGAYLELDKHNSVKEALMAHIQFESDKALAMIREEYVPLADD